MDTVHWTLSIGHRPHTHRHFFEPELFKQMCSKNTILKQGKFFRQTMVLIYMYIMFKRKEKLDNLLKRNSNILFTYTPTLESQQTKKNLTTN